jgi:hypothetical protein
MLSYRDLKRPDKKKNLSLTVVLSDFDPFLDHLTPFLSKKHKLNGKIGRLFAPEWMYYG